MMTFMELAGLYFMGPVVCRLSPFFSCVEPLHIMSLGCKCFAIGYHYRYVSRTNDRSHGLASTM